MTELVRLYFQLALSRVGPQDVPASTVLLAVTMAIYFAVGAGGGMLLLPKEGPWWLKSAADVALTFAWYFVLMRVTRKPERFLQTAAAIFGYQIVLTPVLLLTIAGIRSFEQDSLWQFPLLTAHMLLLLWLIRLNVRIVKAALEWETLPAVALIILQMAVNYLLFSLFDKGPA